MADPVVDDFIAALKASWLKHKAGMEGTKGLLTDSPYNLYLAKDMLREAEEVKPKLELPEDTPARIKALVPQYWLNEFVAPAIVESPTFILSALLGRTAFGAGSGYMAGPLSVIAGEIGRKAAEDLPARPKRSLKDILSELQAEYGKRALRASVIEGSLGRLPFLPAHAAGAFLASLAAETPTNKPLDTVQVAHGVEENPTSVPQAVLKSSILHRLAHGL